MKGKFNVFNLLSLLIILSIFVISGMTFLIMLAFGLYGLSRILIYFGLGTFTYNQGFYENLIYYGSYIVFGYFTSFIVEYVMEWLRKKLPHHPYLQGLTFHLLTYSLMVIMFYFLIHIHYEKVHIDLWVLMVIIAFLYLCKEIFYPDSEDLNQKK
ncbi:SepA family multidrug efflux transporter [Staphylococcus canis]|uniref:Multidrug resistance efflux pump SepA n=1 Tax=Staphylococcus canis TaxID=2724942 RepID=A0ABS0TAY0_9STAP|nr:SepA family multidrug efflux transporter [Staphylococcus canis]MBI5975873.1 SepA family multidrug efflux transporter [Staphylococcus canis]